MQIEVENERLASSTERVKKNFKHLLMDILCLIMLQDLPAVKSFLLSHTIRRLIPTAEQSRIPKADYKELQQIASKTFESFFSPVFLDEVPHHLPEKINKKDVLTKLAAMRTMVQDYFNGTGRVIIDRIKNKILIVFDSSYHGIPDRQLEELYTTALEATDPNYDDSNMTVGHCGITTALILRHKMYDKPIEESQGENDDMEYEELVALGRGCRRKRRQQNNTRSIFTDSGYTKRFVSSPHTEF